MHRARKKKRLRPYDEIQNSISMDPQVEIRELSATELDELRDLLEEY